MTKVEHDFLATVSGGGTVVTSNGGVAINGDSKVVYGGNTVGGTQGNGSQARGRGRSGRKS